MALITIFEAERIRLMNYLAHIYLSFGDDGITLGNFIADSIRGNQYKHLPERIQQGIILHRAIDTFTDTHPIPRISSKRLHVNYSHYSRVIVDIFYDHFLARNWKAYSDIPLDEYVGWFYGLLQMNYTFMPPKVKYMMPYLIDDNWLVSYADLNGIAKVLQGMNRRTRNKSGMDTAIRDLEENYSLFEHEFTTFFEELILFSRREFQKLVK
jgi:acyl carrier protein phosphodiesterase